MKTFTHSKNQYKMGLLGHNHGICMYEYSRVTGAACCLRHSTTWIGYRDLGLWYCDEHIPYGQENFKEELKHCFTSAQAEDYLDD